LLCVQNTFLCRRLATTPELSAMGRSLTRASSRTPGAISWPGSGSAALHAFGDAATHEESSRVLVRLRAILVLVCVQLNNIALLE
jgi:hypothetical protein